MEPKDQQTTTPPAVEPAPAPAPPAADVSTPPAKTEDAPADNQNWDDPEAIAAKLAEDAAKAAKEDAPAEGDDKAAAKPAEGDANVAPAAWNEQAKAAWDKLPLEIKAEVRRVETAREQFLGLQYQERQRATEISQAIYNYAQTELTQTIQAAQASIQGDFGGIDWEGLHQSHPELALKLEGLASRRMASLQAIMDQQRQLTAIGESHHRQELERYYEAQAKEGQERVKAVVGAEFVAKEWKAEAVQYLTKMGVPPDHIAGLAHGYQVEIVAKAMKYDQLMGTAKAAEAKLAAAPKVMPPKAASAGSNDGGGLKSALATLKKDPYSNDNIAAALANL
jgi:hypothetical protein